MIFIIQAPTDSITTLVTDPQTGLSHFVTTPVTYELDISPVNPDNTRRTDKQMFKQAKRYCQQAVCFVKPAV